MVATAALVVIAPAWSRRLVERGWPKPLADALAVAGAAQVVTAPLVAGISGRVSLVAAAANFVVAPVIAPITVLGSAAAVLARSVAGGCAAADPIHRARAVVGAARGALGGRCAGGDRACAGRRARGAAGRLRHACLMAAAVAVALVSQGDEFGAGGRDSGLLAWSVSGLVGPLVTPSWGE